MQLVSGLSGIEVAPVRLPSVYELLPHVKKAERYHQP